MANRFTRSTPLTPMDNFLELPVDVMAQAVEYKQTQYNSAQDAFSQFQQSLNEKEYLPGDNARVQERQEELLHNESKLRLEVGGDLSDPRYQKGYRDLINKEQSNPFYKNASYSKDNFVARQKALAASVEKNGRFPSKWQDPDGDKFENYINAEESEPLTFSGILDKIAFVPTASAEIDRALQLDNVASSSLKVRNVGGKDILYNDEGYELTKDRLRQMVNGAMQNHESREHERMEFEENPELMAEYGDDFEKYYQEVLVEGVVDKYFRSYRKEEFKTKLTDPDYGRNTKNNSSRSSNKNKSEEAKTHAMLVQETELYGKHPIGHREYEDAKNETLTLRQEAANMIGGYTNSAGVYEPPLKDKLNKLLGLDAEVKGPNSLKGRIEVVQGDGSLGLGIKYLGEDGTVHDLSGNDLISRIHTLPKQLQDAVKGSFVELVAVQNLYNNKIQQANANEEFNNRVVFNAFNGKPPAGFRNFGHRVFLNDKDVTRLEQIKEIDNLPFEQQGAAIKDALTNKWFSDYEDIGAAEKFVMLTGKNVQEEYSKARNKGSWKTMNAWINNFIEEWNPESPEDTARIVKELEEEKSKRYAANNSPEFEKVLESYQKSWENGLDENGNPKNPGQPGEASGIKLGRSYLVAPRVDYDAKEEKRYKQRMLMLSTKITGSGTEESRPSVLIYGAKTGKLIADETRLTALNSVPDGKGSMKNNFEIVGVRLDGVEGPSLMIRNTNEESAYASEVYEIRNPEAVNQYMIDAGVFNAELMSRTKAFTESFLDKSEQFTAGTQEEGQHRMNSVGTVGHGIYQRPVRMLQMDTRSPDGQLHKAGTFAYTHVTDGETRYYDNAYEVVEAHLRDEAFINRNSGEKSSVTDASMEDYYGFDALESSTPGKSTLTNAMQEGLRAFATLNTSGEKMKVSDAFRPIDDDLYGSNPNSKHTTGNAVDLSPYTSKGFNYDLVDQVVNDLKNDGGILKSRGMRPIFEYGPKASVETLRIAQEINEKYQMEVIALKPRATGNRIHLHLERGDAHDGHNHNH